MCPRSAIHRFGETSIASLERAVMDTKIARTCRRSGAPVPGARWAVMVCVLALVGAMAATTAHASGPPDRSDFNAQGCQTVPAGISCPPSDALTVPVPMSPFDFLVLVGVLRIPAIGTLQGTLRNRCASPAAAQESGDCPQPPESPGVGGGHPAMTMI
jgi:hypothetical protein